MAVEDVNGNAATTRPYSQKYLKSQKPSVQAGDNERRMPPPQQVEGAIHGGERSVERQSIPANQTVAKPVVFKTGATNTAPSGASSAKLVEAAGFGNMPWDGVQSPSPLAPTTPPSTKSPLMKVDATRGVIGTIRYEAQRQGVPVAVALAVAREESGYRQEAVSPAGAIGIMQLMPATAKGLGVDPENWKENIRGGIRLLSTEYAKYGNWSQALEAYNGGPGNVGSSETQHYASTVLGIARSIRSGAYKPAGGSTAVVTISAPLPGNPVVTSGFGPRTLGGAGDFHEGVDLAAPQGTPIHAMIGGKVTFSGWTDGTGNMVTIQDKTGRLWSYFHMVAPSPTRVGQQVTAGNQIGNVGSTGESTGPHLDIHLMVGGQYVNPMAIIAKGFKAGWDKTSRTTITMTDTLPPGSGGVNGSGQTLGYVGSGVTGAPTQPPQTVDAAVVPGGQAAMPSNAQAWQRIVDSGPVSPETKNLADRAGAMTDTSTPLAAIYQNPGG